jgi:hypothetical protein
MKEYLQRLIRPNLVNYKGQRLGRKVIVFESDDWGSIRTTAIKEYRNFKAKFGDFDNPYLKYDSIASLDDLNALFEVLRKFKDKNGNNPIITFNTVVGNPNFEKIKACNYNEYFFEPFTETLKRYYPSDNIFDLWKEGIKEGLIYPQFHGREHVNVPVWLEQLQSGNQDLIKAFELGTWSTPRGKFPPSNIKLQASLDFKGDQPKAYQEGFIIEGLDLFEKLFGFRSETMIANNFVLPVNLQPFIKQSGVKMLQGMKYHVLPYGNQTKRNYLRRYYGQKDSVGLFFNVRNCTFEPSQTSDSFDDVGNCLKEIENAFFWKKPAVITTHRLNFIGTIIENNRKENLNKFRILLSEVLSKWPDVEFLSCDKLIQMI